MLDKLNFFHSDKHNFPNSWCAYRELPNSPFAMCICSCWEACFFFCGPLDRNANNLRPCVTNYCFISRRAWDIAVLFWGGLICSGWLFSWLSVLHKRWGTLGSLCHVKLPHCPTPVPLACDKVLGPVIGTLTSGASLLRPYTQNKTFSCLVL